MCSHVIPICSGITYGRVLNEELYAQSLQKFIYVHLFTDCFMKISLQSSEQICLVMSGKLLITHYPCPLSSVEYQVEFMSNLKLTVQVHIHTNFVFCVFHAEMFFITMKLYPTYKFL